MKSTRPVCGSQELHCDAEQMKMMQLHSQVQMMKTEHQIGQFA